MSCWTWPRPAGCAQPGVLAAQVKRMIADERADALVSNFTGQWLQLRNLESKVAPDLLMFPDFDDNIRKAFRRETEMLFAHILRENRSALELLSADYTFVNERLARHYGIPGVYGARFRQVKLTDPNRRGLLGHGSVLSLTSVATRTSPVYPRQVRPDDVPEHAAAAAAAERADARGEQQATDGAQDGARAARAAPHEPGLRVVPPRHRSRRALRSRSSTPVGQWRTDDATAPRSTPAACWPTAPRSTARWRCGNAILSAAGRVRHRAHRAAA